MSKTKPRASSPGRSAKPFQFQRRAGEDDDAMAARWMREMKAAGRRDLFQHLWGAADRRLRKILNKHKKVLKRWERRTTLGYKPPASLGPLRGVIADLGPIVDLFYAIRFALEKKRPDAALVAAIHVGQLIQRSRRRMSQSAKARHALVLANAGRRERWPEFAEAWKASAVSKRNRAAALAPRFHWTPKHAREVAKALHLRK